MRSHAGFLEAWTATARDVYKYRYLIKQLFIRDFKAQYQRSVLGILWTIIMPLIPVTVYLFMSFVGVLRPGVKNIPYPLFVVVGMSIWRMFADGTSVCMTRVLGSGHILKKIRTPKVVIILAGMGSVCFDALVRAGLIVVLAVAYWTIPSFLGILLASLSLLALLSFTLALGMIAALFNVVVRDVQKVIQVGLTYGMFLSSVIFVMPETGLIADLIIFYPMNTFVMEIRHMLFFGLPINSTLFLITSGLSVAFLIAAVRCFYVLEHVVDDKL
jgi:lipopolysaccharide transport system permease protein